jgi:hypothetical protein
LTPVANNATIEPKMTKALPKSTNNGSALKAYLDADGVRITTFASHLGVNRITVWRWCVSGVPLKRVNEVAAETGIKPALLRPDLAIAFGQSREVAA